MLRNLSLSSKRKKSLNMACSRSVRPMPRQVMKIHIFEVCFGAGKSLAWRLLGVNPQLLQSAHQMHGDNGKCFLDRFSLRFGRYHLPPDSSLQRINGFDWHAFEEQFTAADDRHPGTKLPHVLNNVCVDKITTTFRPIELSKLRKRFRSAGSSPALGSSTMINLGLASSAWAIPNRCFIPPE